MTAPFVPAPPPGPGVHPPYPAPPVEGKGKRAGRQFGIAGGVIAVIVLIIVVVIVGITVSGSRITGKEAVAELGDYLDALVDQRYQDAYADLCERAQEAEDFEQYSADMAGFDITDYTIGDFSLTKLTAPVHATYDDGTAEDLTAEFDQDSSGRLAVCGLRR